MVLNQKTKKLAQYLFSGPFRDLIYLKSLVIGHEVQEIKYESFINAYSLESIIFEQNSQIKIIGDDAFANAISLVEVDLPISLQHLGIGIFRNASSLQKLRAPFIGEERETSSELFRSHDILVYFFGSKTYLHYHLIPDSLKEVEFYDIDQIHNSTFYKATSLEVIILPDYMTQIGIRSFYQTHNLRYFEIPFGVTHIPESAFEGSGVNHLVIPSTVTYIDLNAFKNTNLEYVIYYGEPSNLYIDLSGNDSLIEKLKP